MHCQLDHLTITAPSLAIGQQYVEERLGISPQQGGEHVLMGTHNLLLRLGTDLFLEVIAAHPQLPAQRARWFGLDQLTPNSPAKLRTWVARTPSIQTTLQAAAEALGEIEQLSRGSLNWLMAIPKDGSIAMEGAAPALIEWQTPSHPAQNLKDYGISLLKFKILHPEPKRVEQLLASIGLDDARIVIEAAKQANLMAYLQTNKRALVLI